MLDKQNFECKIVNIVYPSILNNIQPCNYQLSKGIVHGYSCHVNINNLPYRDRYSNTDWQIKVFERHDS